MRPPPKGPAVPRRLAAAALLASGGACAAVPRTADAPPALEDVPYGAQPRQRLDLYLPAAGRAGPRPAIVFFHPGAFRWGDKGQAHNRALAASLARRGAVVAVPNYRLLPAGRFPHFLEDAAEATAWVARSAGRLGADPSGLFLAGHSAGGYIAAMLALDPRWLAAAGLGPGTVAGAVGLAGMYAFDAADLLLRPVFGAAEDPAAQQPVAHVRAGAPPLLLLAGALDPVGGQWQAMSMASQVRAAGGEARLRVYPLVGHMGLLAPALRQLAPVADDIMAFAEAVRDAGRRGTEGPRGPAGGEPRGPGRPE